MLWVFLLWVLAHISMGWLRSSDGVYPDVNYSTISFLDKLLFPGHSSTDCVGDEDDGVDFFWVNSDVLGDGKYSKTKTSIPLLLTTPGRPIVTPFLIVYFHGNAESLSDARHLMKVIAEHCGCAILSMEYPGYGMTSEYFNGGASPLNVNRWVDRTAEFIRQDLGIPPELIVPFGRSIGTGPASRMALGLSQKESAPAALILNAPYLSINRLAREIAGSLAGWFIGNPWDNLAAIEHLGKGDTMLAVIHGQADGVIPVHHGIELHDRFEGSRLKHIPVDKGHNDLEIGDYLLPIEKVVEYCSDQLLSEDQKKFRSGIQLMEGLRQSQLLNVPPSHKRKKSKSRCRG